jgi:hypothetical protein
VPHCFCAYCVEQGLMVNPTVLLVVFGGTSQAQPTPAQLDTAGCLLLLPYPGDDRELNSMVLEASAKECPLTGSICCPPPW